MRQTTQLGNQLSPCRVAIVRVDCIFTSLEGQFVFGFSVIDRVKIELCERSSLSGRRDCSWMSRFRWESQFISTQCSINFCDFFEASFIEVIWWQRGRFLKTVVFSRCFHQNLMLFSRNIRIWLVICGVLGLWEWFGVSHVSISILCLNSNGMLLMISANIYTKIIAAATSLINRKYFPFLAYGTDWKLVLTID